MKTDISFNVDFDYTLSENLTVLLTATVQLRHSTLHYLVFDIDFKNNPAGKPLLSDIDIIAVQGKKGISWVHVDSRKETTLSVAVGRAIQKKNMVEFGN